MDKNTIILIIVFSLILVAIGAIIFAFYLINEKRKLFVKQNSAKLKELFELNNEFSFYPIENCYEEKIECNNKRQFDKFDFFKVLKSILIEKEQYYIDNLYRKAASNVIEYEKYCKRYLQISETKTDSEIVEKFGKKKFNKIEAKFFEKYKLNPICKFDILLTAYYTSPQGRNSYKNSLRCLYENIIYYFEIAKKEERDKQTREYKIKLERAKMSDKLRFEILKRDNYRCCICGRNANEDGVKLEVDHIVPVSKGGKTEFDNLQTLCERCNRGKSNKSMN